MARWELPKFHEQITIYYIILYDIKLYYIIFYCIILYHIILYYIKMKLNYIILNVTMYCIILKNIFYIMLIKLY